jgi:hydrogenase nickel incorporation protein HypA/HybF
VHELSVASGIAGVANRHADGRRVTVVTVRIGGLRQVVPRSLSFYWDIVTRGGPCEGSRLEQVLVPVRLRCETCAKEWEPEVPVFWCGGCGATAAVIAGEELEVESLEVEEAECTA